MCSSPDTKHTHYKLPAHLGESRADAKATVVPYGRTVAQDLVTVSFSHTIVKNVPQTCTNVI